MAISIYHDFVLVTDTVDTDTRDRILSFHVRVFDSPQGQGEKPEPVTVGAELDEYLRFQSIALENRQLDLSKQIELGYCLGKLLLQPDARMLYDLSLEFLRDKPDQGLRIRLRLEPELSDLPWEYIYVKEPGPQADLSGFAILNPRVSFVRHEALALRAEWFEPPASAEKRRVVIAMATPEDDGDYPRLEDLPEEQHEIDVALHRVRGIDPVFLPHKYGAIRPGAPIDSASFDQVKDALAQPTDIFHFSGHGVFEGRPVAGSSGRDGKAWIIFADEQSRAQRIPAECLARVMESGSVRLVFLGACETAKGDRHYKLSSCAVALLAGHVGCVVAMQFRIYSYLAALFAEAFYEALVAGLLIDEAVALGRGAIRDRILADGTEDRDWGVPVLHLRTSGGRVFNPVTDGELSSEAGRRSGKRFDMGTAWWNWMAEGLTASEAQLHRLEETGDALILAPAQAIMLIRSAQVHFVSPAPWLSVVRRTGADLVERLDDPFAQVGAPAEARRTLSLDDEIQRERPSGVGPLAWTAVRLQDEPFTRQTAALTLTALPRNEQGLDGVDRALDRLDRALAQYRGPSRKRKRWARLRASLSERTDPFRQCKLWTRLRASVTTCSARWGRCKLSTQVGAARAACRGRWERFKRRAELRGALADADPALEARNRNLHPVDRFGAWLWRVRRRVIRDRDHIIATTMGTAAGAGLALGILRALLAFPTQQMVGLQFAWYSYIAFILGGALGLGLALSPPILLLPRARQAAADTVGVVLGTVLFSIAHLLVALLFGMEFRRQAYRLATGMLSGLGLAFALYGLGLHSRRLRITSWLLRAGTAAAALLLAQFLAMAWAGAWEVRKFRASVEFSVDPSFYQNNLSRCAWFQSLHEWSQSRCGLYAGDLLALVDAAVVGIVLVIGMVLGLVVATRLLDRYRALVAKGTTARKEHGEQ